MCSARSQGVWQVGYHGQSAPVYSQAGESYISSQFNNAGIMHPEDDNALNTEEKIWDLTQNINVKGGKRCVLLELYCLRAKNVSIASPQSGTGASTLL